MTSYDRYLEANPRDDKTRRFVYQIKKKLASGELNRKLGPKRTGRELNSAPFLGLGGGAILAGDTDAKALYGQDWDSVSASGVLPFWNVEAGYLFSSGFLAQVALFQGVKRSIERSGPKDPADATAPTTLSFSQSATLVMVGWLFPAGGSGLWGLQGGAGPTSIQGPGGTSGDSVAWAGEMRYDYLLGRQLSLGLRLGWFSATFNDFKLEHNGFNARLGLDWYLFPLRDKPAPVSAGR